MNVNSIKLILRQTYLKLKNAPELGDVLCYEAYQATLKPTPLEYSMITLSVSRTDLSEQVSVPAPAGTTPPFTYERTLEFDIKLGFFIPYKKGFEGCLDLYCKSINTLLRDTTFVPFDRARSTPVRYVRDVDGLTFDTFLTYHRTI